MTWLCQYGNFKESGDGLAPFLLSNRADMTRSPFCSTQHLFQYVAERLMGLKFDEPAPPVG